MGLNYLYSDSFFAFGVLHCQRMVDGGDGHSFERFENYFVVTFLSSFCYIICVVTKYSLSKQ